jgi:hypothetical protein
LRYTCRIKGSDCIQLGVCSKRKVRRTVFMVSVVFVFGGELALFSTVWEILAAVRGGFWAWCFVKDWQWVCWGSKTPRRRRHTTSFVHACRTGQGFIACLCTAHYSSTSVSTEIREPHPQKTTRNLQRTNSTLIPKHKPRILRIAHPMPHMMKLSHIL